jgi:hypothetical protein
LRQGPLRDALPRGGVPSAEHDAQHWSEGVSASDPSEIQPSVLNSTASSPASALNSISVETRSAFSKRGVTTGGANRNNMALSKRNDEDRHVEASKVADYA